MIQRQNERQNGERRAGRRILILGVFAVLGLWDKGFAADAPTDKGPRYLISIIRLIGSPETFDGKEVVVQGVFADSSHDSSAGLYVSREFFEESVTSNAVLLHIPESVREGLNQKSLRGKYVTVRGRVVVSDLYKPIGHEIKLIVAALR